MVELCFITYKDPSSPEGSGLASSRPRTSAIRSHARLAAHRHARHERMSEYQIQSSAFSGHCRYEQDATVALTHPEGHVAMGSPFSYLDSLRRDPFQSLVLPLNEVEQMLIDYCKLTFSCSPPIWMALTWPDQDVTVFALNPSPSCTVIIPVEIYTCQVMTQWVPFAFADRCLLNGLFLQACRKIAAFQGHPQAEYFGRLALKYKIACIQLLRTLVSSRTTAPSDKLIAGSLFLALDEVRQFSTLSMVS